MATAKLKNASRVHPHYSRWVEDEARMRASFVASRRLLIPFLARHRFEGTIEPQQLDRAKLGYGVRLNYAYASEIQGHIKSADVTREWGALAEGEPEEDGTPSGGVARSIHADATGNNKPLDEFMAGEVLEWLLSSLGGFIVVDAPPKPDEVKSKQDEKDLGHRPYFRFVPWSRVKDFGLGERGFRFVKFAETVDNRTSDGDDNKLSEHVILYELKPDNSTRVTRANSDGKIVNRDGTPGQPVEMGTFLDLEQRAILPLVPVRLGIHPELATCGTGVIYGLDDIVIDIFNTISEMREAYRDACFGVNVHKGPDADKVRGQFASGSRFIGLGEDQNASLERMSGDSAEVAAGITQIELAVKAWALSAKRQAAEAMQNAGAEATSGVSLQAEFQLDLKPLLVTITKALDAAETLALFIAAQMADQTVTAADKLSVRRSQEFNLEDEATRIARIVKDVALSLPLAAEAKVRLAMKWLEMSKTIDLSEPVTKPKAGAEGEEQTGETVGQKVERELRELYESKQQGEVEMNRAPVGDPDSPFPKPKVAA